MALVSVTSLHHGRPPPFACLSILQSLQEIAKANPRILGVTEIKTVPYTPLRRANLIMSVLESSL